MIMTVLVITMILTMIPRFTVMYRHGPYVCCLLLSAKLVRPLLVHRGAQTREMQGFLRMLRFEALASMLGVASRTSGYCLVFQDG